VAIDLKPRVGLADLPRHAEQLGHLSVAWASLEFRLFCLFWVLSGAPLPLAQAIFYSQRTTRARLDIILAVAPVVLRRKDGRGTTKDYARIKKLLGNIGTMAGERNKYIHDPWGGHSSPRHRAVQFRLSGKGVHGSAENVSRRQLLRLTDKIATKVWAARRLFIYLRPKMPALHDKLGAPQVLTLVRSKTSTPRKKTKAKRRHLPRSSRA
jgi:hypothetical protein